MSKSQETVNRALKEFEAFIESCSVDDGDYDAYAKARNRLHDAIEGFETEMEHLKERLPCKTEEEMDFHSRVQRREVSLIRRAKDKLIELGDDPDQTTYPEYPPQFDGED